MNRIVQNNTYNNIMNTTENKEKFFCLYLGQRVESIAESIVPLSINNVLIACYTDSKLLLKSLTDISYIDELYINKNVHYIGFDAANDLTLAQTDYLRSKGYLLPFGNISIPDIISFGWVKII